MITDHPDRRRVMQLLAAVPGLLALGNASSALAANAAKPATPGARGPEHDFDFFLGSWHMTHRRLKQRLVGSNDWEEFDGSTHCQALLGGIVNLNDTIVNRPTGTYRGMGLRAFDAKTGSWADWYLDGRNPTNIDVPGKGRFADGVGTFYSEEVYQGTPVRVRGTFSHIAANSFQWDQAFSTDSGKTWETNWVMRYTRTA